MTREEMAEKVREIIKQAEEIQEEQAEALADLQSAKEAASYVLERAVRAANEMASELYDVDNSYGICDKLESLDLSEAVSDLTEQLEELMEEFEEDDEEKSETEAA